MVLATWWMLQPAVASSIDGDAAGPRGQDHYTDHTWALEIEGVTQGVFTKVSGLDSNTDVIELHEGKGLSRSFEAWLDRGPRAEPLDFELVDGRDGHRYFLVGARPSGADTEVIELVVERLKKR
jgi:glutathione S-transferase